MADDNHADRDHAHALAMVELLNNEGEHIDWDYWAGKMPRWTAYQAVRLMAALDPVKHSDLSFKRNEAAGAAKEQATSLERLAASHGMTEASPRDWLKWADSLLEPVHEGCRVAIENPAVVRRMLEVSTAPGSSALEWRDGHADTPTPPKSLAERSGAQSHASSDQVLIRSQTRKGDKWSEAELRQLLEESILPGMTAAKMAPKYGVSPQRIRVLLKQAKEKLGVSKKASFFPGVAGGGHRGRGPR